MFEAASRVKLRFESIRGILSTEDLWDLPLTSKSGFDLDTIAKFVNKYIKELEEESFVKVKSSASNEYVLKLDILKHIINFKIEEAKNKKDLVANRDRRNKILGVMAKKQDDALEGKSFEELEAELKTLS